VFSFPEAARFLNTSLEHPDPSLSPQGISIDTRTLKPGDFFLALQGTKEDGHRYLEEAFKRGASGALISRSVYQKETVRFQNPSFKNLLPVADTAEALAELGKWHRRRFSIPVVGITGSVGKTSTKEFLSFLLREAEGSEAVLSNRGNFNNQLGLPISLLYLDKTHRCAVNELGANHAGEIAYLATILQPTAGILTMVAPVHLEGFGSLETIYETKLGLIRSLPAGAPAVIPDHDEVIGKAVAALDVKALRVGTTAKADYRVTDARMEGEWVNFRLNGRWDFSFPGAAPFLAVNAAMALAMMEALGYSLDKLPSRWERMKLPDGRFTPKSLGQGIRVIFDAYNASPESFDKALKAFHDWAGQRRKIVIFADMLELGGEAEARHRELGRKIASGGFDAAFAYGSLAEKSIDEIKRAGGQAGHFNAPEALAAHLEDFLQPEDRLLLKGSRGMKLEKIFEALESRSRFKTAP
jgi:UDP-N-acetylmuramoyl-tripeptide--D-alanyl-D-alanine ligase